MSNFIQWAVDEDVSVEDSKANHEEDGSQKHENGTD